MTFIFGILVYIFIGGLLGRITYEIAKRYNSKDRELPLVVVDCHANVAIWIFAWPFLFGFLAFAMSVIGVAYLFCLGVKK